jgi:bacteriorhodopsin
MKNKKNRVNFIVFILVIIFCWEEYQIVYFTDKKGKVLQKTITTTVCDYKDPMYA